MKILTDNSPTSNPLNDFLKNYGIWIAVALAAAAFIAVVVLFIIAKVKSKNAVVEVTKPELSDRGEQILLALGGKENILEHSLTGSRMTLVLTDYNVVNEAKLNELGVDSVIKMSNKIILVIKDDMSTLYREMF
ncbi:MAG: hypothetical protein K6E11_00890 [Bacilli bacterium]|nr:hypothetical protein [Bacilli bacterium]